MNPRTSCFHALAFSVRTTYVSYMWCTISLITTLNFCYDQVNTWYEHAVCRGSLVTHRVLKSHRSKMVVSWITYDQLYYTPCFACWALFGSLVRAMCNHTLCAQVHQLPQSHCGDNREGALFSWLHIYICMKVCM